MTVLQRVREDPERVRAMLAARHFDAPLDRLLELDAKVRQLQSEKEQLQAERNKASKGGPPSDAVKALMRRIGDRIKQIDHRVEAIEAAFTRDVVLPAAADVVLIDEIGTRADPGRLAIELRDPVG